MYGGSVTSSAKNAVLYTEQNLTEEQKSQARSNIGIDESFVDSTQVRHIVVLTQDEYDAITEKDPYTEYNIIESI